MQSVGRAAQPCRPWRRGGGPSDRGGGPNGVTATAEAKPTPGGLRREDKNMNTVAASSPRRLTKDPPNRTITTNTRAGGVQPRTHRQQAPNPALSRLGLHQKTPASSAAAAAAAAPSSANRGGKTKPRIIPRGTGGTTASKAAVASKAPRRPSSAAAATDPQAPLPLPSISASPPSSSPSPLLALDANCNEPSLPCLCCDGRSPQDSNSMFNHNHNNNNAVSIRRQLRLQLPPGTPPPARLPPQRHDGKGGGGGDAKVNKGQQSPASSPPQRNPQEPTPSGGLLTRQGEGQEAGLNHHHDVDNRNVRAKEEDEDEEPYEDEEEEEEEEEESSSAEISDSVEDEVDDDDDDDDDDTLVPSCCDCPASLLDFSLTSSTSSSTSSSSSTSISSCSDLESDCADLSSSCHDLLEDLNTSSAARPPLAVQDQSPTSPLSPIPLKAVRTLLPPPPPPVTTTTTSSASTSPMLLPPCSPDEGYPSAPGTPTSTTSCSDYLGVKGHETGHMGSEVTRLGLLDFLESLGEFGKMERFSQVVQVARWDLEQQWEVLRDRLDHLDRMEKVNRQVRLVHAARLHEKGLEGELDLLDEMGNNMTELVPWKLYRSGGRGADSQEFSDDGGVDLTAPSDCDDEPPTPDSLAPSPLGHAPRPPSHRHAVAGAPPKPPARHASVTSDLSDYVSIVSRETTSSIIAIPSASPTASSAFSPRSPTASPTFSTFFRCEKPPPAPLSSLPPLPLLLSQPPPPPPSSVPYFSLYDDEVSAPPPPLADPPRPVPPPRRRHLARKEAKRLAALQAAARQQEEGAVSSPLSLPPPSGRPPPLPPPPVVSIVSTTSSPPAVPPPPSFHALDDEIRKLLMLAGLTQAELLRLSPELGGVCPELGGLCTAGAPEERVAPSAPPEDVHLTEDDEDDEPYEELERCHADEEVAVDGWRCSGGTTAAPGGQEEEEERGAGEGEEARKKTKKREEEETSALLTTTTTSFGELARRRKRYTGRCSSSDLYYTTTTGGASSPPPPPPPRPLPPIPRSSSAGAPRPTKFCNVSANAARPERFDWLIAFTPEDAGGGGTGVLMAPPPQLPRRRSVPSPATRRPAPSPPPVAAARRTSDAVAIMPPKLPQRPAPSPPLPPQPPQSKTRTSSSSSSSSSPPLPPPSSSSSSSSLASTGSRVTTFKELRLRSKNNSGGASANSLATVISSDPDPDPSIMTPDPDILYNLRWRRETQGGDGSQWEYTSQAHEVFMQPPALASLDALREMLRRDEEKKQTGVRGGPGGTLLRSHTEPCKEVPRGTPRRSGGPAQQGGVEEEKQATKWRKEEEEEEEEEEVEVRGRADGGRTLESRSTASSTPLPPSPLSSPYFLHSARRRHDPHPVDPRPPNLPDLTSRYALDHDPPLCPARPNGADDFDEAAFDYDFLSESLSHFDSLYFDDPVKAPAKATTPPQPAPQPGCSTPYKNVDAMLSFAATDSLYTRAANRADPGHVTQRASKALPPLPTTCYLYHPKNCPLHRGAPPRLSPVGALSPPHRPGAPPAGVTDGARLRSPLFPRSHTLPALAAPLYYPYLYPPPLLPPPPLPPLPPKNLCQATTTTTTTTTTTAAAAAAAAAAALQPLPRALTVRSVSFAGSTQRGGTSWMGDEDVHVPARGPMSSLCHLQDKKALVSAVSIAVEAILAQFTSSRTVVQKALSGDSSVNPSVGRVVVQCLCPALWGLLSDGLKPHQSDLISGRRPNSAWGLVQASTKPGPSTQALYSLQVRVGSLPQLRQSKHRFNAFLLGLLNTKSLDLWLFHLQSCTDVLESFYQPRSFLRLPTCRTLFEEVLLLLQPLSLLTFNLDLLFQHHHLLLLASQPSSSSSVGGNNRSQEETPAHQRGGSPPTAPAPTAASRDTAAFIVRPMANKGSLSKTRGRGGPGYLESLSELDFGRPETNKEAAASSASSSSPLQADDPTEEEAPAGGKLELVRPRPVVGLGQTSPQLMWVQEKHLRDIAPPVVEEVSLTQQAEQVLQQGWGAVVRWGGRLGHNLTDGLGLYGARRAGEEEEEEEDGEEPRSDFPRVDGGGGDGGGAAVVPWGMGRFFGASRHPSGGSPLSVHTHTARRPSEWIAPGVTALTRMVSSTSTPILRKALEPLGESYYADREPESLEMTDKPRALRSVRTLCDHSGAGEEELSFHKGEELELLGGVDHDWIRCRRADKEGLVPIGYASLIM